MGTRHLICVVKNNQYRVAQYGQWDGYPSGQGASIVEFMTTKFDPSKFREQIDRTRQVPQEEVSARWKECGADDSGFVNMDVSARFKQKYPQLQRDCGADILEYIQNAEQPEVHMNLEFAADSLFCEWAYVVNLDTDELEVFKGFNRKPLDPAERFASMPRNTKPDGSVSDYYPVRLLGKISFAKLTRDSLMALDPPDEE